MNFDEYQGLARRTQNPDLTRHERRDHALCGLAAEVGEIHGLYQKTYQGHQLSPARVEEELGDLLWFAAELCDVLGVSLERVAEANIGKLRARYPEGFDEERSLHREATGGSAATSEGQTGVRPQAERGLPSVAAPSAAKEGPTK